MSNDLISRKEAIKVVKTIIQAGLTEEAIYAELEEIPTAYDVDAVINELESVKRKLKNCWAPEDKCLTTECTDCALEKAIEIVRNGGKRE